MNGQVKLSKNNVFKELENWGKNYYIQFSIKRTTKPKVKWTNILHITTGMYLFLMSKIQSCQKELKLKIQIKPQLNISKNANSYE